MKNFIKAVVVLCISINFTSVEASDKKQCVMVWGEKIHSNMLTSVVYSPDGKIIASASEDKTISLINSSTGKILKKISGHAGEVWSLSFSPDGKYLASASSDRTVRIWSIPTGKLKTTLTGHTDSIWVVAYSPDGKHLLSGGRDNTINIYNPATGKIICTFKEHTDGIRKAVFSSDGKTVVSGGFDRSVKFWEAATGKLLGAEKVGIVDSIAVSPDKTTIAVSNGGFIDFFNIVTMKKIKTIKSTTGDSVFAINYSPDGMKLVSARLDNIDIWDLSSAKLLLSINKPEYNYAVLFSPDGKFISSGGSDMDVSVWKIGE